MLNRRKTYTVMTLSAILIFGLLFTLIYFNAKRDGGKVPPLSRLNSYEILPPENRPPLPKIQWPTGAGQSQSLQQWNGQVIYINYWANWCEPCKAELPLLAKMAKEFPEIRWVFVNLDTDSKHLTAAKQIAKAYSKELHFLFDVGTHFTTHLPVNIVPTHFVIDKNSRLATSIYGDVLGNEKELKRVLQALSRED